MAAPVETEATLTCSVGVTDEKVSHDLFKFEWYKRGSTEMIKMETPVTKVSLGSPFIRDYVIVN